MMFDTHCHLNFSRFKDSVDEVVIRAKDVGVTHIIVPGTDAEISKKALEIASKYPHIYAAVGIHPHHAKNSVSVESRLNQSRQVHDESKPACRQGRSVESVRKLLSNPKVVAIGEVGLDRHEYHKTKYEIYKVDEEFLNAQKELLKAQIKLAIEYDKSLILHNWEAKDDLLPLLDDIWDEKLKNRTVFHCCEPDEKLLEYAREHGIFIGVDGDVTYSSQKQQFIKTVPLEMLVLETDSPYLLPEPLKSQKKYPNEPANILIIAEFVANLKKDTLENVKKITFENSKGLFLIN